MIARRLLLGTALATLVAASAASAPGADASSRQIARATSVYGYVEAGDGAAVLRRSLRALTGVGIDGVNISSSGAAVSSPGDDATSMLRVVHAAHKRAELLVGNFSDAIGDFDPASAHRLFASASHRRAVIASLVADTRRGWDGVQLDLESLDGADRNGLTLFTTELRAALASSKSLSMAVMASTTAQGYLDDAYDLRRLSARLTRVVLMAYDQHGPTWSGPGPIGGLPWARQALAVMLRSVPRAKAVLGVAGYGYTWPSKGTGTQLSDAGARRTAVSPTWDAAQAEWHSSLRGGGSLWWSDARSLKVKIGAAHQAGVGGVAVWSLGLSDTIARQG